MAQALQKMGGSKADDKEKQNPERNKDIPGPIALIAENSAKQKNGKSKNETTSDESKRY